MSLSFLSIAATEDIPLEKGLELTHFIEEFLVETASLIKVGIESVALLILVFGIIKAIIKLLAVTKKLNRHKTLGSVRLDLGLSLALSLEFLLAADIAATAVSPSWDAIGKLAAISGIRTFLNYFLQKEVEELEKNKELSH